MCSPYCSWVLRIREIDEDELPSSSRVARGDAARARERRRLRRLAPAGRRHGLAARGAGRRDRRRRLRAHRLAHPAAPLDRSCTRHRRTNAARGIGIAHPRRARGLGGRARRDRARRPGDRGRRGQPGLGGQPRLRRDRPQLATRARPDHGGSAEPTPPEGIEIVTWAERPELARRDVRGRARGGARHPGRGGDRHRHARGVARAATCRATATTRAPSSSRSRTARSSASRSSRCDDRSDRRAFHDLTGVKRAHRGRGIAAALKRTQIAWAKEHGYTSLQTSNEVRNEPIRRLNERHGYVARAGRRDRRAARRDEPIARRRWTRSPWACTATGSRSRCSASCRASAGRATPTARLWNVALLGLGTRRPASRCPRWLSASSSTSG